MSEAQAPYGVGLAVLLQKQRRTASLRPVHYQLVEVVCTAAAPQTIEDIALAIGRDRSRVSRLVQQLVTVGLVQRGGSRADRRLVLIAPTAKARALDQQVRAWLHHDQPAA